MGKIKVEFPKGEKKNQESNIKETMNKIFPNLMKTLKLYL